MKNLLNKVFIFTTLSAALLTIAHENDKHKNHKMMVTEEEKNNLVVINEMYVKDIKSTIAMERK